MVKGWDGNKWREASVATEYLSNFLDKHQDELTSGETGGSGSGQGPPP